MKKVKDIFLAVFGVSSTEFSGFRLLVITLIICSLGVALADYLSKSPYANFEQDSRMLDSLLVIMEEYERADVINVESIKLEKFDPNSVSEKKLLSYGFPTWLATRLVKYRTTGARFYKPKDLLKLYGFPEPLFATIKDYIEIKPIAKPKRTEKVYVVVQPRKKYKKAIKVLPVFDINEADTSMLKTISGIGSKLSVRIIEYRTSLGGFIHNNQLYQVYGLDSLVIKKINNVTVISPNYEPQKIDINMATKSQLAGHPYINWTEAKLIIAYRNQHGSYMDTEDLLKVYSIDKDWVKNAAPYLSF